ncbi:MAG: transglutaminase-like domain-containing protein [Pseudomonadales bacterium]
MRYSIRDFAAPPSEWPENEVRQAEEILASLGLIDSMTARDKILRIAAHLHNELDQHRGSPEPFMRRSSAWQQYVSAIGGRSRVYCSNFAEIFAFFASVAGVPTRLVDVRGHLADVPLAAHAFNEAYDSDSNQWMYVDLQLSVGAILTASGRALNGVDILLRRQASNQHDLIVKGLARGKISNEPISEFSEMVNFFIPSEATLVYLWASANRFSVADRALRLMIYPQPAVSIRQSRPNSTLRLLPSYIGAVGFVFSVCILLYLRGKRRRPL